MKHRYFKYDYLEISGIFRFSDDSILNAEYYPIKTYSDKPIKWRLSSWHICDVLNHKYTTEITNEEEVFLLLV